MQYLIYTYVDRQSGRPVTEAPASAGPVPPAVAGLDFAFALESQYPTDVPVFYGTADDDAEVSLPGVMAVIDEATFNSARATELADRDRKRREQMVCSKLQAKRAVAQLGLAKSFLDYRDALATDPVANFEALAFIDDAQTWKRLDPTFNDAADAMGKTEEEKDAFFALAVTL